MTVEGKYELQMVENIRPYLASVDTGVLRNKIKKYEKLAQRTRTRQQIVNDIFDVLMPVRSAGLRLPSNRTGKPAGTKFYRARIIDSANMITHETHLWEAPAPVVPAGRLNLPHDPLIYTAISEPATAAYEVRMSPGDLFAMIEYESMYDILFARIENVRTDAPFKITEQKKLDMIFGFLQDVFTQRTHPNASHVYAAPEIVAKYFFDFPPSASQGWGYPSIADPSGFGYNLCFRPEVAKEYLRVNHVAIGRCTEISSEGFHFEYDRVLGLSQGSTELSVLRDWNVRGESAN